MLTLQALPLRFLLQRWSKARKGQLKLLLDLEPPTNGRQVSSVGTVARRTHCTNSVRCKCQNPHRWQFESGSDVSSFHSCFSQPRNLPQSSQQRNNSSATRDGEASRRPPADVTQIQNPNAVQQGATLPNTTGDNNKSIIPKTRRSIRPGRRDRELMKASLLSLGAGNIPGPASSQRGSLVRRIGVDITEKPKLESIRENEFVRKSVARLADKGHTSVKSTRTGPTKSRDREPRVNVGEAALEDQSSKSVRNAEHGPIRKDLGLKENTCTSNLSLLEELFPAEAARHRKALRYAEEVRQRELQDLPRLDPPDLGSVDDGLLPVSASDDLNNPQELTEASLEESINEGKITVMVLIGASNVLTQADFDRVIPKGEHIEEWRGPGEYLKVIPARDTTTLRQLNYYFLLFSNPTYAHAYQSRLNQMHKLAQTHTPTSISSRPIPPPGVLTDGLNAHQMLQDFTLCPPSQPLHTRILFPPLKGGIRRLLAAGGYPQLTQPHDRGGRAVLFWVEGGHEPSKQGIEALLATDGQDRGMQWGPLAGKGSITPLATTAKAGGKEGDDGLGEHGGENGSSSNGKGNGPRRWIISFEDEGEARRFARTWHLRPFPSRFGNVEANGQWGNRGAGEPPPVVNAVFMW